MRNIKNLKKIKKALSGSTVFFTFIFGFLGCFCLQVSSSVLAENAKEEQNVGRWFSFFDDGKTEMKEETHNLWKQIPHYFYYDLAQTDPRIRNALSQYTKFPLLLEHISQRAEPYLYYIFEQVKARHMPGEIALLPIVESAFNPYAYSYTSASGLWQIIPSTAKHSGLKINWWYDGRRDLIASTNFALDYLQYYYRRFGDWLLALAAYNCGGAVVKQAIEKAKKQGFPVTFWFLDLPRETTEYVRRLLAISHIISVPDHFNLNLPKIADRPYFKVVTFKNQIDLTLASQLADISLHKIYLLNPGFNRWASAPRGPHRLLLPIQKVQKFREKLATYPHERRLIWERYIVTSHDSLLKMVKGRYGLLKILKEVNNLKGDIIKVGSVYFVPRFLKEPSGEPKSTELNHEEIGSLKRKLKVLNFSPQAKIYVVRKGDSLSLIAKRNKVRIKELLRWNKIKRRGLLRVGQKLKISRHKKIIFSAKKLELYKTKPC